VGLADRWAGLLAMPDEDWAGASESSGFSSDLLAWLISLMVDIG
jgi:hypothetical protein